MVYRFHKISVRLARLLISVMLVIGLAALPALAAAHISCAPDCPMHQPDASAMDCCASEKACSSLPVAADKHHPLSGPPDAACDDLICFDSSVESFALTSAGSSSIEGGHAVYVPVTAQELFFPDSIEAVRLDFFRRPDLPPIYKRICLYLI